MNLAHLFLDNPELRRNLSLELTPARLLWTPVFLVVAVGLCFLPDKPIQDLAMVAQWVGLGIWLFGGLVWGALRAAQSVRTERMERTWDSQRLTAMSAGQFAVGKVFGATAHNLYLQGILVFLWGGLSMVRYGAYPTDTTLRAAVLVPGTLLVGSIVLWSLMVAQSFLETDPVRSAKSTLFSFAVPLVAGIYLATHLYPELLMDPEGLRSLVSRSSLEWWGIDVPKSEFQLASLCLFLPWAWFGLWRALRRDLQEIDFPWAWPMFLLFVGVYVQGFAGRVEGSGRAVTPVGLIPLALLGWGFLLTENLDPMGLRRILDASGSWWERLRLGLPFSWLSLPLAAVVAAFAACGYALSDGRGADEIAVFLVGGALLAARDVILFSWISCRVPVGRQGLSRMALAVGVHVFLPVLTGLVMHDPRLVWPYPQDPSDGHGIRLILLNLGSLGLQAALAWGILAPSLWTRLRKA